MGWSITVGRIAGTAVRIHVTFLMFLAFVAWSGWSQAGAAGARYAVVYIVLIFLCVLAHEFGHILAARRYGVATPDVTLLPIGGLANLERIPEKPSQELVVALAGPAVNVVIALVLFAIMGGVAPQAQTLARLDDPGVALMQRVATTNVFLVLFNLIPAFPMDGGRVLRALLAMRIGRPRATQIAARIGQGLAFLFGFLGLMGNPMLLFIAIFVYIAAGAEAEDAGFRDVARNLSAADGMETRIATLPVDSRVDQAVDALLSSAQHDFPIVDAAGRPVGLLSRAALLAALKDSDPARPILDLIAAAPPIVAARLGLTEAVEALRRSGGGALLVVDPTGRVAGMLTQQNVAEMMMVRAARPDWEFARR